MAFEACPISGEYRNERVVRIVAGSVVVITLASVALGPKVAPWVFLLLAVDFAIRGFGKPKYSPLATLGRGIANTLKLEPKKVDAAPKKFAARIGVVFSLAAAALYLAALPVAAIGVAAVLAICAFLESAFALCVGCKVYALLPTNVARALAR